MQYRALVGKLERKETTGLFANLYHYITHNQLSEAWSLIEGASYIQQLQKRMQHTSHAISS